MVFAWLRQLKQTFGVPFLLLVVSVYWTQGFRAFPWTGISYLMKDELKLSPSASQLLTSTAFIPWSIKPVYGIFSDCVYIYGNRRIPYLLLASMLSIIAWAILAFSPGVLQSTTLFTTLLICQNLGSAMADVVVDAMVAETAKREREEFAGDLQTLSWFAMALGGVSGSLTGGPGLKALKPSGMFAVFTLFPILQFFTCFLLNEKALLAGPVPQPPSVEAEAESSDGAGDGMGGEKTGGDALLAGTGRSLNEGEDAVRKRRGRGRGKGGEDKSGSVVENGWHGERRVEQVCEREVEEDNENENENERMGERDGIRGGGWEKSGQVDKGITKVDVIQPRTHAFGSRFASLDSGEDVDEKESDSLAEVPGSRGLRERQNGQNGDQREEKITPEGRIAGSPLVINGDGGLGRSGSGRRKGAQKKKKKWSLGGAGGGSEGERTHSITKELKNVSKALWDAVRRPAIVRPLLWFMLSCASVPSLQTIMFYFHTNALHLDPAFLGTSRVAGWGGLMVGTLLYSAYLKHVPLRRIFLGVHSLMALVTLGDAMLVSRLNIRIGLPDKVFVLISAALFDAVNQFRFMPFLILSARLCPPGVEGTLFAVFMSAYNLGGTISGYLGATLATSLGVTAHSFARLGTGIGIQAACTLLPVLFLGMIPADATGVSEHDHVAQTKPKQKKRK